MTAIALAIALTMSPLGMDDPRSETGGGYHQSTCTQYSWKQPPSHIRVLRAHHRGSPVRKRVEVWTFDRYDTAVLASGASGNRVRESAKVFAVMVRNWALYQLLHTCRTFKGKRYDVSDSEQFIRRDLRPWSHLPVRTLQIVRIMAPITITKNGHHLRLGWSGAGGSCHAWHDGYHAQEDQVRDCAERLHMGWRGIMRLLLGPRLRIIGRPA